MTAELKITLKKSPIGRAAYFGKVLKGLGLNKLQHTVCLKDTPEIRGMIRKVDHMVVVED
ncbi:MAG: 50S ribosomal protein L30 [Desulfuromonadales bacterium]|nr:50S ribosomal protein L30 [Desulfuromonadales bacterium]